MDQPRTPDEVERSFGHWRWELVYQSGPEVATYKVESPDGVSRYIKVAELGQTPGLEDEASRMRWAAGHLPVPEVLEYGSDGSVCWMTTVALPGRPATDPIWAGDPKRLVTALAEGLRSFHEAPVDPCPFPFRVGDALEVARWRVANQKIDPDRDFHPEFSHLTAADAVRRLEETRPSDEDLVVCHGDYCLPNVLLEDWRATGYVDLGELGIADRWWDLAVATWSVTWNLGPGYEDLFLAVYGIPPDPDRTRFYRLLYDVVS